MAWFTNNWSKSNWWDDNWFAGIGVVPPSTRKGGGGLPLSVFEDASRRHKALVDDDFVRRVREEISRNRKKKLDEVSDEEAIMLLLSIGFE